MRQIGTVASEADARKLADFLLTLHITTHLMPAPGGVQVWVHKEDEVPRARAELEEFLRQPGAEKYQEATARARPLRKEAARREREHYRHSHDVRYFWSARDIRRCPVAWTLIAASVAVTLVTNFGKNRFDEPLMFASAERLPASLVPADLLPEGVVVGGLWIRSDPLKDLRRGEIWRPITPIFLHFDPLHLLFDMAWLFSLGCAVEIRRSSWRLALLVLVAALASNLGQYAYTRNPFFGGMSGVDLALFGYVWMKGLYEPALGLGLDRTTVTYMMLYLAITVAGGIPGIGHAAHLVGLFTGMLIGLGPHLFGNLLPPADGP